MHERTIRIKVLAHKKTGLFMALSDDLPGLVVHARSTEEIDKKMPIAIREILEASGVVVDSVEPATENLDDFTSVTPPAYIANTCLAAAE